MCAATPIVSNMDELQKHHAAQKKARHETVHIVWFHLCEAQKMAKLIYGNRNQKVVASGRRAGINCKGTRGNSGERNIHSGYIVLDGGYRGIYNCLNSSDRTLRICVLCINYT